MPVFKRLCSLLCLTKVKLREAARDAEDDCGIKENQDKTQRQDLEGETKRPTTWTSKPDPKPRNALRENDWQGEIVTPSNKILSDTYAAINSPKSSKIKQDPLPKPMEQSNLSVQSKSLIPKKYLEHPEFQLMSTFLIVFAMFVILAPQQVVQFLLPIGKFLITAGILRAYYIIMFDKSLGIQQSNGSGRDPMSE